MWIRRLLRGISWLSVGISTLLLLVTLYAYLWQPDHLAAYTVMPVWGWACGGLLLCLMAWWLAELKFSRWLSCGWLLVTVCLADEVKPLLHPGASAPPMVRDSASARSQIRVLTLNCNEFAYNRPGNPIQDIVQWQPDIVFLQEVWPGHTAQVAQALFHGKGEYRVHRDNGIICRWKILREVQNPRYRDQEVTILHPQYGEIELVNLHLKTAATDLRLWKRDCWRNHRVNRALRRDELNLALDLLRRSAAGKPCILGGDFNAPATDPLEQALKPQFRDAFEASGTGWGNTFQRRIPILRIDQLHFTHHFQAVHCAAHTTRQSDHRMVIADFTYSP
jgi:endonuclease/exonuclease/phosphatase (EEP) superfamily protein YafD